MSPPCSFHCATSLAAQLSPGQHCNRGCHVTVVAAAASSNIEVGAAARFAIAMPARLRAHAEAKLTQGLAGLAWPNSGIASRFHLFRSRMRSFSSWATMQERLSRDRRSSRGQQEHQNGSSSAICNSHASQAAHTCRSLACTGFGGTHLAKLRFRCPSPFVQVPSTLGLLLSNRIEESVT